MDIQRNTITLLQLNQRIKQSIENQQITAWVTAEIGELSMARQGHIYMELVEKSPEGNLPIARLRCNIWAHTASVIMPKFIRQTSRQLSVGMKVMVLVSVSFHEVYGLAAVVGDIEATFTLGDIERKRRETLEQLENEGVIDMNRDLNLPLVFRHVAVVSSRSAAGYGDFCNQLINNTLGYKIRTTLYDATMQGATAEKSIISALERVAEHLERFDAVVVIRGGGSKSDLACFDSYDLANNLAQFPLPVLTGIGHERDNSVADVVAHTRLKTPTAVAEFLVAHNADFESTIVRMRDSLRHAAYSHFDAKKMQLQQMRSQLQTLCYQRLERQKAQINQYTLLLQNIAQNAIEARRQQLKLLEETLTSVDPRNTLKRGYTITFANGVRLFDANVKKGDKLLTVTALGEIISVVE